jgi:hypothetical protein
MTRTFASIAFLSCALLAGCATDQSAATSPQADPGYVPTGSNIPRRTPAKVEQPAAQAATPAKKSTQ